MVSIFEAMLLFLLFYVNKNGCDFLIAGCTAQCVNRLLFALLGILAFLILTAPVALVKLFPWGMCQELFCSLLPTWHCVELLDQVIHLVTRMLTLLLGVKRLVLLVKLLFKGGGIAGRMAVIGSMVVHWVVAVPRVLRHVELLHDRVLQLIYRVY